MENGRTLGWLLAGAIVCIGGGSWACRARSRGLTRWRPAEVSALPAFRSDNKRYDAPLFTLGHRSALLFSALREWAAIGLYRVQGKL